MKTARKFGLTDVDAGGLVAGEKVTPYRDTRGPGTGEVRRMLSAPDRQTPTGKRDYALLILLWENALRRSEV